MTEMALIVRLAERKPRDLPGDALLSKALVEHLDEVFGKLQGLSIAFHFFEGEPGEARITPVGADEVLERIPTVSEEVEKQLSLLRVAAGLR